MRTFRHVVDGISLIAVVFGIRSILERHGFGAREVGLCLNGLIILLGIPVIWIERRLGGRQR